jgi:predicted nucleotidyltransferase
MEHERTTTDLVGHLFNALPRAGLTLDHKLALVGSWARGDADEDSDIDVLFFGFSKADTSLVEEIRMQFGEVASGQIDIIKAERLPANVLRSQLVDAIYFWPEQPL